ncbi:MAG: hypothetical protein JXQ67_02745 [Campylobacterales bacterium]|nr:hypothetical protein [Campylobacterales bacterium]
MLLCRRAVKLLLLSSLIFFSACGYKPSSKYARSVVGEKVSTSIVISSQDPENTVVIKDAVDSAIIEVFHASLVDKSYADTNLLFSISPPTYTPVQYDNNGFIIGYRATIMMRVERTTKESKRNYNSRGTYDFAVDPNAVITDQDRFNAIKFSATKAIASFIAQVSAEGSRLSKE